MADVGYEGDRGLRVREWASTRCFQSSKERMMTGIWRIVDWPEPTSWLTASSRIITKTLKSAWIHTTVQNQAKQGANLRMRECQHQGW